LAPWGEDLTLFGLTRKVHQVETKKRILTKLKTKKLFHA
jgi:hypothetical protein